MCLRAANAVVSRRGTISVRTQQIHRRRRRMLPGLQIRSRQMTRLGRRRPATGRRQHNTCNTFHCATRRGEVAKNRETRQKGPGDKTFAEPCAAGRWVVCFGPFLLLLLQVYRRGMNRSAAAAAVAAAAACCGRNERRACVARTVKIKAKTARRTTTISVNKTAGTLVVVLRTMRAA